MFRPVYQFALAASVSLIAPQAMAQTASVLPGPDTMSGYMETGETSVQTVSIIDGKFFPPLNYARKIDYIAFDNHTDVVQRASAADGSWTTEDIAPGESVTMQYNQMLISALVHDPLLCITSGLECLMRVDMVVTDSGEEAEIVRVFPEGGLFDNEAWNAFYLVVARWTT